MILGAGFMENFEAQLAEIRARDSAWTKETCLCEPEKLMDTIFAVKNF